MNRHLRGLAVAALATGVSFAVPAAAGADPVITAPSGSIEVGRTDVITGSACIDEDSPSTPTYAGQFVAFSAEPENLFQTLETPTQPDGSWSWELTPNEDTPLTGFEITFYCSTAPITDLSSPDVLWASAPYTKTVTAGANRNAAASTWGTKNGKASSAPLFTVDQESLPRVDKLNIQGKAAAALKARADKANANFQPAVKAYNKVLARFRGAKQITPGQSYVTATYLALSGKAPTTKQLNKGTAALDAGQPKVQVVEDIALGLGYK